MCVLAEFFKSGCKTKNKQKMVVTAVRSPWLTIPWVSLLVVVVVVFMRVGWRKRKKVMPSRVCYVCDTSTVMQHRPNAKPVPSGHTSFWPKVANVCCYRLLRGFASVARCFVVGCPVLQGRRQVGSVMSDLAIALRRQQQEHASKAFPLFRCRGCCCCC